MFRPGLRVRLAAMVLGLAAMPAPLVSPALAQQQAAPTVLPTDIIDYRCFVILQDRRSAYMSAANPTDEQVEIINNLTIISAFYAGRLTHYPQVDAQRALDQVRRELAAATPEERDLLAGSCANFYLEIIDLIGELERTPQ